MPSPPDKRPLTRPSWRAAAAASLALLSYATGAAANNAFKQASSAPISAPIRQWDQPDWTIDVLSVPATRRADEVADQAAAAIRGRALPAELSVTEPNGLDPALSLDIKSTYAYLRATPISEPVHLKWRPLRTERRAPMAPSQPGGDREILSAIAAASAATGVAPAYLWRTAYRESGLRPWAVARSSTAAGLFQFIRTTWLSSLKRYGPALGLSRAAAAITIDSRGRAYAADPTDEENLLALRSDPLASSAIAGALTLEDAARLEAQIGRTPTEGELYVAHVLGPRAAATLETEAKFSPAYPAASILPAAARANHSLFYLGQRPRTALALLEELEARGGA